MSSGMIFATVICFIIIAVAGFYAGSKFVVRMIAFSMKSAPQKWLAIILNVIITGDLSFKLEKSQIERMQGIIDRIVEEKSRTT